MQVAIVSWHLCVLSFCYEKQIRKPPWHQHRCISLWWDVEWDLYDIFTFNTYRICTLPLSCSPPNPLAFLIIFWPLSSWQCWRSCLIKYGLHNQLMYLTVTCMCQGMRGVRRYGWTLQKDYTLHTATQWNLGYSQQVQIKNKSKKALEASQEIYNQTEFTEDCFWAC